MFTWIKNLYHRSAILAAEGEAAVRGVELKLRAEELKLRVAFHDELVGLRQKALDELRAESARIHAEYDKFEVALKAVENLF